MVGFYFVSLYVKNQHESNGKHTDTIDFRKSLE